MHLRIDGYGKFPRIINHPMTRSFCKLENVKKDTSDLYALRLCISEARGLSDGVRAFVFQRLLDGQ